MKHTFIDSNQAKYEFEIVAMPGGRYVQVDVEFTDGKGYRTFAGIDKSNKLTIWNYWRVEVPEEVEKYIQRVVNISAFE